MFTDRTLEELRKEPHLSASGILDFLTCGLSYKFGRVDGVEKENISDAILFGKAIHETLESIYRYEENFFTKEQCMELFRLYWSSQVHRNQKNIWWNEENTMESLLEYGKQLLSIYLDCIPKDGFKVLGIEVPFRFEIEDVPVPVIGCIDLILQDVNGLIIIVDHKTCNKAFSKSDVDKSMQLTLYHLAMMQLGYRDEDILLRFDCLIKTTKPKFEQYYTSRSDEDCIRLVKTIQSVWTAIHKEIFVPNDTWKCRYCPYQKQCNQWFLN